MSAKLKIPSLSLLLALPLATLALERTELLPPADGYVRITQAKQLWKEFDSAYGKRLRADEKVQDFIEAFGEKLKKKNVDGKYAHEIRLFEIMKLLKGEIALVYDREKDSDGKATYLAATTSNEEFVQIVERTAWHQEQATAEAVRKRETFQKTEVIHDIIHGGTTNEMNYWMACSHNTLLIGTEHEWVRKSIIRLQKEEVKEPTESKLSFRFPLAQAIRRSLEMEKDDERVQAEALWNALGLLGVEQYLLEVEIKDGEMVVDGTLTVSNLDKGLFSLLDLAPEDFSGTRIIPDNASSFSYGKIDFPRFWQALPDILNTAPPDIGSWFYEMVAFLQQQGGVDIEHDILAHTGKKFTLSTVQDGTNQPLLVSLELKDGRAMEQSLSSFFASPFAKTWSQYVLISNFRDHTIYEKQEPTSDANPFALCVAGNNLIFGSSADVVRETILRLKSKTMTEPSSMQKTARRDASENSFGYGAMDHQQAAGLIYIRISDTHFSAGIGFQSDLVKPDKSGKKEELGENEISLNHLTSFLNTTYHFAEAVPGGIHHRIVFEYEE